MRSDYRPNNGSQERVKEYALQHSVESIVQEVLDILDQDDGKTFDEKKEIILKHLRSYEETEDLADVLSDCALADMNGRQIKDAFWSLGPVICQDHSIVLRKVEDMDREVFLVIEQEYSPMKAMLAEESYRALLWKEHVAEKALMLSIEKEGAYIGYCGIKNTSQQPWEIAIELLPQWTKQGLGPIAISAMLDAMKARLGTSDFRVRIDPGNSASQKMFERLGAVPNGISEYLLHDQSVMEACEENNLHLINEDTIVLAAKFGVEPRKLLSHILEYTLSWP